MDEQTRKMLRETVYSVPMTIRGASRMTGFVCPECRRFIEFYQDTQEQRRVNPHYEDGSRVLCPSSDVVVIDA
ncbi:hypothetical protein [Nocardia brasiliensis]|uniref:hypothetical protein n=1 Tax=Nocardia brasiliensis TaxID=37326 RepID=UPI002454FF68|nr:hypothetical protein [Nocardia brasiliensis]